MSEAIEKLKPELSRLSDDERADLAFYLLSSLESAQSDLSDATELLDRRARELRSGAVEGIPAEDVMERLRAEFP